MNFIKAFFEDKARVGISIICLFMLCIGGIASLTKDTYAATTYCRLIINGNGGVPTERQQLIECGKSININNLAIPEYSGHIQELDLSNNTLLTELEINDNPYSEKLYVYKGNNIQLGNNIKIPDNLNWDNPTWISQNSSIVSVNETGLANSLTEGTTSIGGTVTDKYITTSTINIIEITSDKYMIGDNKIYTGLDNDNGTIKNNLNIPENINVNIDLDNDKIQVKYNEQLLKEFSLIFLDLGTLGVENKVINLSNNISYENFINNISHSEYTTYKIFNNTEEINNGDIVDGLQLKVYYNGEELDSYDITVLNLEYSLNFDSSLNIDEEINYIKSLKDNTIVSSLLEKVKVTGTNKSISLYDKNGNQKQDTSLIASGDSLVVYIDGIKKDEYTISVSGDITGDGKVKINDLIKLYRYIKDQNNPEKDEEKKVKITETYYLLAADVTNENELKINDVDKIYKYLKGKISALN